MRAIIVSLRLKEQQREFGSPIRFSLESLVSSLETNYGSLVEIIRTGPPDLGG
jgi:hypothetical protein